MDLNLDAAQTARLRQLEFPNIIRDMLDGGATEIELVIDAHTAERLAYAVELLTIMEDMQHG